MVHSKRLLILLCLSTLVVASCSKSKTPAARAGAVTLAISPAVNGVASAKRDGASVRITCEVTLNNRTGAPLIVKSNFSSAFDGLSVVVKTSEGRVLGRTPYVTQQSPSLETIDFPLSEGESSRTLEFVADYVPYEVSEISIQVIGDLPGSAFGGKLESNWITVKIAGAGN